MWYNTIIKHSILIRIEYFVCLADFSFSWKQHEQGERYTDVTRTDNKIIVEWLNELLYEQKRF